MQTRTKWNAEKIVTTSQEVSMLEYQDLLAELWQILVNSKYPKDAQRVKLSSQIAYSQTKGKSDV